MAVQPTDKRNAELNQIFNCDKCVCVCVCWKVACNINNKNKIEKKNFIIYVHNSVYFTLG